MYRMFGSSGPSEMTNSQKIFTQLIFVESWPCARNFEAFWVLMEEKRQVRSLFLHPYDSPSLPKLITYEDFLKLLKKERGEMHRILLINKNESGQWEIPL